MITGTDHGNRSHYKVNLSPAAIVLGIGAVVYSWSLLLLLPGAWLVLLTLPLWLFLVWFLWKLGRRKQWCLPAKTSQYASFWLVVVFFIIAASIFSYYWGYYHVQNMFDSLNIEARETKRYVELLDRFGDIGYERSFAIGYELLEPVDVATVKVRQRLDGEEEWVEYECSDCIPSPSIVWECIAPRFFGRVNAFNFPVMHSSVSVSESGRLVIQFVYEQPRRCIIVP